MDSFFAFCAATGETTKRMRSGAAAAADVGPRCSVTAAPASMLSPTVDFANDRCLLLLHP